MYELFYALGLVLVIEGILYAAFPDKMREMMEFFLTLPEYELRIGALVVASVGCIFVFLLKAFFG